ncbi:LYR motif-containing protein 2 isoform 1-T1 [Liasis olivaceus]
MAASRLPPTALSLKQKEQMARLLSYDKKVRGPLFVSFHGLQFLRRQQVLQLYRKILRTIRQVPSEADRRYMRDWAREDFKRNKEATDEDTIKMMITQGNLQLQELERTLKLAKS